MSSMRMDEHPVWVSLDKLLSESSSGEDVANRFVNEDDLTPLEFLSACASQAAFMTSWKNRVELMRAAKVAIAQDRKRVFGFAESLFRDLLKSKDQQANDEDDSGPLELLEVFLGTVKLLDTSIATQALLRCLYDPILTRVSSAEKAQQWGKRIIDVLEFDLGTYTVQKLLLYSKFREREEISEGSDTDSSLTDWENTSDSTESSLNERDEGCPVEVSAAAAWILAPNFLDPPVLNSFGRWSWAHRHARHLLQMPSNTLAAHRGLELFASFGSVRFPTKFRTPGKRINEAEADDFFDDAYDTIIATFRFASARQSLEARNVVVSFLKGIEPLETRVRFMSRIVEDETQIPPLRGLAMDLIRYELGKHDNIVSLGVELAIKLLDQPTVDDQLALASLALLYAIGLRTTRNHAPSLEIAKAKAADITNLVVRVHRTMVEQEAEINKTDRFQLRHVHPLSHASKEQRDVASSSTMEPPPGCLTPQAELGRARLVAGAAEPVINIWKQLVPSPKPVT